MVRVGQVIVNCATGTPGVVYSVDERGIRVRFEGPGGGDFIYQPHEVREPVEREELRLW